MRSWGLLWACFGCLVACIGSTWAAETAASAPPAVSAESEGSRNARLATCIRHVDGQPPPDYPDALRRAGAEGRVVARLRFTSPDAPPEVTLHHRPAVREFRFIVDDYVRKLRMPCHDGRPFTVQQLFVFVMEGSSFGFKPSLRLPDLLKLARSRGDQAVTLDTTAMACPFDIEYFYLQPERRNGVRVAGGGAAVPSRRPLLEALAESELTLVGAALSAVYADTARVHVPCGRFELPARE